MSSSRVGDRDASVPGEQLRGDCILIPAGDANPIEGKGGLAVALADAPPPPKKKQNRQMRTIIQQMSRRSTTNLIIRGENCPR